MKTLKSVEFHLTDACNLTCSGCNRFNDMGLRGFEDWNKHRSAYENFSKNVEIEREIDILGGEPLLHPHINQIITDLRNFWPSNEIVILTNGLLLHKVKGIMDQIVQNKISLDISVHNKEWRIPIIKKLNELTGEKIKLRWKIIKDKVPIAEFIFNDTKHTITLTEHFYQNSLGQPNGVLRPYESDADKAWEACVAKCPTLHEGKLYKCPISHAMPTALRQKNNIDYTQKQKDLIDTFPYIKCNDIQNISDEEFNKMIYNKIDQCSLCPEKYVIHKIEQRKKINPNYFD